MARIKKFAEVLTQPLTSFQTFLVDTNPNSTYFRITEFKDTFTGGKNGFLIEGSEHLKESTEIKLQILDVNGDPIYYEPGNGIPEYYEGVSKLVAVYVYEDTPIGEAKITVLGELKTYLDEGGVVRDVPDEWKSVYNVKWEKTFKVNKLLSNEDKVRFYRRPEVTINEIVKPIFSNIVKQVTQTGFLNGIPQIPSEGENLTGYTLPTSYLLTTLNDSFWTGSVTNNYITLTNKGVSLLADDVVSDRDLTVSTPYNENGIVKTLIAEPYSVTFNYIEGNDNLKTALTGSFAKIKITDLTTFVGDCARVKIFRRSQSELSDYQFVQEIQLESNELLKDLESNAKNEEYYGSFDQFNYKNYWVTSSNNLTTSFNQNFLYNSVKLNSLVSGEKFSTTKSLDVRENTEYTLTFNIRKEAVGTTNHYVKAYLSGSRISTYNNVASTIQIEQPIVTITSDNSLLQKLNVVANFKAEEVNNSKLYFEVDGSDWYISDVSLRASQETSFSPDEITFIQPIPRTLPVETFDFRFQFYDINNNYIPVLVEETQTFNGGNLNVINKDLQLVPTSLYFQFDSGSGTGNPIPPTTIFIDVIKNYLTGSVNFTSRSFDFNNNELSASVYAGQQYPGLLIDDGNDRFRLTVQNFTGSITDKNIQYIEFTGECEGVTDSIIITRVLDGKGGVNHIIRPYAGTTIRNSSTASLEIQAVRIDGINEINLYSGAQSGWGNIQLHVLSASLNPAVEPEKFINLSLASSSNYINGIVNGSLGSKEINYNAIFNTDSIDFRRTIFLMPSSSAAQFPAFMVSGSVLASMTLEDIRDGDDAKAVNLTTNVAPLVIYDGDGEIISPEVQIEVTATVTNFTGTPFYQFFTPVDPNPAISTQNTLSIAYQDLPLPGESFLINVQVRDGSSNPAEPVAAQASLTIAGLQEGISAYNASLTNDNVSIIYRVSGEVELGETGTTITATKGTTSLTHADPFSPQTLDNFFNEIGSLGEYQVTIHSKSAYLGLAGGLVSQSILPTVSGQAVIGNLVSWTTADSNPIGSVVYRIDFENGNGVAFKTQSFSVQFEGNTGPGIVMRGQYTEYQNYIGSYETTNLRRDAVIWPDPSGSSGVTHYFAALSGSGPNTYVNPSTSDYYVGGSPPGGYVLIGHQYPPAPTNDNDYWQYLGEQDFFVAAKIAIFDESFVKNTINIGNNPDSSFANIVLAGGRTDPYMAIGQVGTIGSSGDQTGSGIIGYDRPGIFLGMYENAVPNGTSGRFSISNADGSKAMKWDGTDLTIIGGIRQISPGVREPQLKGVWTVSNEYFNNDVVSYNGQSWICTSATSHISTNDTNASTGYPGYGPWNAYISSGSNGESGPGVVYRGPFASGTQYFNTATRRDVVKGTDGQYYLCKLTYTPSNNTTRPIDGGSYTTYWETFGATFSSVATDVLLAQDATIARGLVIGTDGLTNGFIRSTGATSLVTGSAAGFYLAQDGQFRFGNNPDDVHFLQKPPYIQWDNNVLTIKGRIITDENQVSRIGNWNVDEGRLQDDNAGIVLNPNTQTITINEGATPRVIIKQSTITDPTATGTNVTIDPPSISIPFTPPIPGYPIYPVGYYTAEEVVSAFGSGFTVPTGGGTFAVNPSPLNWGSSINISLDSSAGYSGDFYGYMIAEIWDSADFTGTQYFTFLIAQTTSPITTALDTKLFDYSDGFSYTVFFNTGGTFYCHLKVYVEGYVSSGDVMIYGSANPQSQTFSTTLDQLEIGRDGLLAAANSNNYAKIQRTDSAPILDIKTTAAAPGLRITNTNASGRAIEVLDGDIFLSGVVGGGGVNNNNIRIQGGWIGTDNTSGGVRMGTDGTNSVLMGGNWPSQVTNVATARLRPGTTKFGINGRELIFDSSTIRIKKDIEDYPQSAYDSIKKLKPVLYTPLQIVNSTTYETNGEEDYQNNYPMPNAKEYIGKQGGFIAEWLDADPEMRRYVSYGVSGSAFSIDSLAYDKIVVPLTKAVQILMDKVEALESHISSSK